MIIKCTRAPLDSRNYYVDGDSLHIASLAVDLDLPDQQLRT